MIIHHQSIKSKCRVGQLHFGYIQLNITYELLLTLHERISSPIYIKVYQPIHFELDNL